MDDQKTAIIRLENITKTFPGVVALDNINLSIFPGEIHAIIGENGAGKSTLMNLLAGELQPDEGVIYFKGEAKVIANPAISQSLGIAVVFQELALCPNLSIAENISLWQVRKKPALAFINRKTFKETAVKALTSLGVADLNLNQPVSQLSVAKQQLVEISKAISTSAEVLILDEPNSALTQEETDHLFNIVRQLKDAGVTIIYISHHLEEVLALADKITVLRDGKLVDTIEAVDATITNLIARMVGRTITTQARDFTEESIQQVSLEIRNLSSTGLFEDVSFEIRSGEIVGIAGLPDSHKDELVEGLFGLRPIQAGQILIHGKPVKISAPADAIREGMFLIPADRRGWGAFLQLSLQDNTVVSSLKNISLSGFIKRREMQQLAEQYTHDLDIRASSLRQIMANLSGGNQQKVILARGLATKPFILVLHEPTRGIDVGAKAEIYRILDDLARQGSAILIISSELPELISQCDRILVMHDGRVDGIFSHTEASEEQILACAMGHAVQTSLQ